MKVYIRAHRKGAGFVGRFIAWFTYGKYKHISMVFEFDEGSLRGFQSTHKGVHFFDTKTIGEKNIDVFEVPCSHNQALMMLSAANDIAGAKYDWAGIYGFIRRAKRHSVNKWFCSEAASWVCERGHVQLQRLPTWKQSPVLVAASMVLVERPEL